MKEEVSYCSNLIYLFSSRLAQWLYVNLSWRIKSGSGNLRTTICEYLGQIYSLPIAICNRLTIIPFASPPSTVCALNVHTLHEDILYELLIRCRDLISLKRLIFTHPEMYHAFNNRRRLVLRAVFRTQSTVRIRYCDDKLVLVRADRYLSRMLPCSAIDRVALREALWPTVKQLLPSMVSCQWAIALLTRYHQAGLKHNQLMFAKEAAHTMLSASLPLHFEQRTLLRVIARTYASSDTPEEAIELDAAILQRLDPQLQAHRIWIEDFMQTYRNNRNNKKGLDLQLKCWQLCRDTLGLGSKVALDCAQSLICSYHLSGEPKKAIELCRFVQGSISPKTPGYTAWMRKLMDMLYKASQDSETREKQSTS